MMMTVQETRTKVLFFEGSMCMAMWARGQEHLGSRPALLAHKGEKRE